MSLNCSRDIPGLISLLIVKQVLFLAMTKPRVDQFNPDQIIKTIGSHSYNVIRIIKGEP